MPPVAEPVIPASASAAGEAPPREAAIARDLAPPSFMVTRRPALELSLPLNAAGAASRAGLGDDNGFDLSSPLDVPAFLRRPN